MKARGAPEQLRSLVERPGPFISLYLNTEAAAATGAEELELRWRALRDRASSKGAEEAALEALDGVVSGSQRRGDGLAAFLSGNEVGLRRHLGAPIDDDIRAGALPHLVPLLEWDQAHPRYAVVLSDRVGAEIHVIGGERDDETVSVEGDEEPIRKVQPGGWSQRRYQNRAENTWEANAKQVADRLADIARSEPLAFVVVAGDVRAVQFLRDNLVPEVEPIAFEIDSGLSSLDELREDLERAAASYEAQTTKTLLERFQEERGQQDRAVEGAEATLAALRMAQVDTLLVNPDSVSGSAWFATSDLTQAALERGSLMDMGLDDVEEAPLVDVLVRGALGTGAGVRIVPSPGDEQLPSDGVGGILRYTV